MTPRPTLAQLQQRTQTDHGGPDGRLTNADRVLNGASADAGFMPARTTGPTGDAMPRQPVKGKPAKLKHPIKPGLLQS
jgi:hypothetical protein